MADGIWATWYNVDDSDRDELLRWSHEEYFPFLKSRPGISWVTHFRNDGGGQSMKRLGDALGRAPTEVPRGGQFLVLVGASSPQVFMDPLVTRLDMPAGYAERLALRRDSVTNIFVEQTRVIGPAGHGRDPSMMPGPVIQMGSFRISDEPQAELRLGEWYAKARLPSVARMAACVGTRKLVSVAGWAKHGILYEFTSMEGRLEQFEEPLETQALDPKAWTGQVVSTTIHTPGSPVIGPRIWPPVTKTD